jgi:hypothetical protein
MLSDYGAWYMILLGGLAIGVMVIYRQGLWGLVGARLSLFPLLRRFPRDAAAPVVLAGLAVAADQALLILTRCPA